MEIEELKEIVWKNGEFVDLNGDPVKSITPIGIPKLFAVDLFNKEKYTIKDYIPLKLELLQKEDEKYTEVNAYLLGDYWDYDEYTTSRTKTYTVSFYRIE